MEENPTRRPGVAKQVVAVLGAAVVSCAAAAPAPQAAAAGVSRDGGGGESQRPPDVWYEPSAPEVVRLMLDLAQVGPADVVYDLGCGDGRIVIEAARRGARGVGIDIDPALVRQARANARAAGVEDRVEIVQGDLYETDLRGATVVMLFLQPEVNLKLRPQLRAQLRPGARVVSHWHDMGDWAPDRIVPITAPAREAGAPERRNVYLWTIRATAAGR